MSRTSKTRPFIVVGNTGKKESAPILAKSLGGVVIPFSGLGNDARKEYYRTHHVVNYGRHTKYAHINPLTEDRRWDKAMQADIMHRSGVPCAKYWTAQEVTNLLDHGVVEFPLLRRKLQHADGQDIKGVTTRKDILSDPQYRYVPVFEKDQEFRLHIVCGQVVELIEKELVPSVYKKEKNMINDRWGDPVVWKGDWVNYQEKAWKKKGSKYEPVFGAAKLALKPFLICG